MSPGADPLGGGSGVHGDPALESGALADVFSVWGRNRALVSGSAVRVQGVGQATSGRGKGGNLSGRGDQPDEGGVIAASARCGPAGDLMPCADHSCPDSGNEEMDLLSGPGGEKTVDSEGDDFDRRSDIGEKRPYL